MITGAQIRAARGLIRWSADTLADRSKLGVATVRRAENVDGVPTITEANLAAIQAALEAAGVEFIPENGGGAGVRRRLSVPQLERVSVSSFDGRIVLQISYRGRTFLVTLQSTILEDMDRANYRSDAELKGSFDRHANLVILRAAEAIDKGRATENGSLNLDPEDFPEA